MPSPAPPEPGQFYHIYNRGADRCGLFVDARNYGYFLDLCAKHVASIARTFAYCLSPNHFHFLVGLSGDTDAQTPGRAFPNLFNAYAKAFNRTYGWTVSLFQRPFGRLPVTSEAQLVWLVVYIHQNPQKRGIVDDFRGWPYSSYQALASRGPTQLQRDEVLAWFGGIVALEWAHRQDQNKAPAKSLVATDIERDLTGL